MANKPEPLPLFANCSEHGKQEAKPGRDVEGEWCLVMACGHLRYVGY